MTSAVSSRFARFRFDLGIRKVLLPEWRELLSTRHLREDVIAGVTVACVAVPLSLAIALASEVRPAVGLVTAIVAGLVCALFGGTRLAVSGPAAAMAVLIGNVVEEHGVGGLLVVGLGCGLLQLVTGVVGLGRLIRFVPVPVIEGFTAGIGAIIFIGQLPRAFGLPPPGESHVFDVIAHMGSMLHHTHPVALALSVLSVGLCLGLPRLLPRVPAPLAAVVVPTVLVAALGLHTQLLGAIPRSLPMPHLPAIPVEGIGKLFSSTLVVFALASLETLLSSTAADKLAAGTRHDPDQELIGQGLGNVVVALFGGIPVTGVIARTALNIQAGARTRRSSIIHSLVLVAVVFVLAPLIGRIPLAALAGVLLAVALRMLNPAHLRALWRVSRTEAVIYIVTFLVIVLGDLILGVQAGLVLAFLVAAIRTAQVQTHLHVHPPGHHARVSIRGPVTFLSRGNIEALRESLARITPGEGLLIDLTEVNALDVSGAETLVQIIRAVESRGDHVALLGLRSDLVAGLLAVDSEGRIRERLATSEYEAHLLLDPHRRGRPIERLVGGVERFRRQFSSRYQPMFGRLADAQDPHTLFITCWDSRIVPNLVTSTDPGELLLVRNIGNVVPPPGADPTPAEGAAVEYALRVLAVKEIVVCGHSDCSAMRALLHDVGRDLPSVQRWLDACRPILERLPSGADLTAAVRANIILQLEHLRAHPVVREKLAADAVRLHGWYYDIGTGTLEEWSDADNRWVPLGDEQVRARAQALHEATVREHTHAHPVT